MAETQERFPDDPPMQPPQAPPGMMDPNLAAVAPQGQPQTPRSPTQAYLDTLGPPQSDESIMQDIGRIEEGRGKTEQQAAGRMESRLGAADAMLASPIRPPAPPHLQNIPQRPNLQYRDAFQAFQSPAVLLATLGSLFTRRSAVNALTAGAGALNGYMEGDEKRVQLEEKNWKNAVEQTVKQNEVEMNEFNSVFKNTELAERDRNSRLLGIFAANRDELGLAALKTGSAERLEQLQAARLKGNDALRNTLAKVSAEDQRRSAGLWDEATIDMNARQYIKSGKVPPQTWRGVSGQQNSAAMFNRANQILQDEEGLTPQQAAERITTGQQKFQAAQKTLNSFATGVEGRSTRAIGVALSHLDVLEQLVQALHNRDNQLLNSAAQRWAELTGDPAPTNFDTAKQIVGQEVIKSVVPGAGGVTERQEMAGHLSRAESPAQLLGGIATAKMLMKGQLDGLRQQYESNTQLGDFDRFLPPQVRSQLGGGSTPAPPSGDGWSVKVK